MDKLKNLVINNYTKAIHQKHNWCLGNQHLAILLDIQTKIAFFPLTFPLVSHPGFIYFTLISMFCLVFSNHALTQKLKDHLTMVRVTKPRGGQ